MTTVTVVRKNGQVAIAADTLVTFGDTRLPHGYEDNDKLFRVGESWFGMSGTTAHFPVLRKALELVPVSFAGDEHARLHGVAAALRAHEALAVPSPELAVLTAQAASALR